MTSIDGLGSMHLTTSIATQRFRSKDGPTSGPGSMGVVGYDWPIRRALRVLVVADQKDVAGELVWRVRRWGHAGYSASTSVAALQIAAAQHPDVVLLDMKIPLIDGCQLAQQLRCDFLGNDCFIVACMERVADSLRRQCTRARIDLVLIKPVDPALLEILLLLERELVSRPRTVKDHGTRVSAKTQCIRPSTDESDIPHSHRRTGGSPC